MSPVEHYLLKRFVWADVLLGLAIPPELSKSVCGLATDLHNESPRSRGESSRACPARSTSEKLLSAKARCQLQLWTAPPDFSPTGGRAQGIVDRYSAGALRRTPLAGQYRA
jgi:hypothetical protein